MPKRDRVCPECVDEHFPYYYIYCPICKKRLVTVFSYQQKLKEMEKSV